MLRGMDVHVEEVFVHFFSLISKETVFSGWLRKTRGRRKLSSPCRYLSSPVVVWEIQQHPSLNWRFLGKLFQVEVKSDIVLWSVPSKTKVLCFSSVLDFVNPAAATEGKNEWNVRRIEWRAPGALHSRERKRRRKNTSIERQTRKFFESCFFVNTSCLIFFQQRRKAQMSSTDLDEAVQEMLEQNRELRRKMDEEIQEMRARSVNSFSITHATRSVCGLLFYVLYGCTRVTSNCSRWGVRIEQHENQCHWKLNDDFWQLLIWNN